jgi:ferredoxin
VLQLLVAGLSIHRVPRHTAVFLLVLIGSALVTGLVFREPRSFCRTFCPAGALLSVYGRSTPFGLEMRDASVCARCRTKDCVRPENRFRSDKRSCPSLLRPYSRQASDSCLLCLECAKICPHDNVGLGLVSSTAPVRRRTLLRPYEAAFVMVALGFVAHETIGEVGWIESLFHALPAALGGLWPSVPFGWFEAAWFLVAFPMVVWGTIALGAYVLGHRGDPRSLALAAATGAAPVVAVAHLAKALAKVTSWGGYLPLALGDPRGLSTLHRLAEESLRAPPPVVGIRLLGWLMLALVAAMAFKAWRCVRQMPADQAVAARTGLTGAAVLYMTVLTIWTTTGP